MHLKKRKCTENAKCEKLLLILDFVGFINTICLTFFPYCINEWSKRKVRIKNTRLINILKKSIVSKKQKRKKKTRYFVFTIHSV